MMFLFTVHPENATADNIYTCDYKEKARLNAIASNITVNVDYVEAENNVKFIITLTNLHPDIYIKDTNTNIEYKYDAKSTNPNELKISGYKDDQNVKYEVYSIERLCKLDILITRYVTIPPYNKYYNDPLCKKNSNHSLCKKWLKVNYNYETFKKEIEKKESQVPIEPDEKKVEKDFLTKIIMIFINNYIYIFATIIIIGSGTIYVLYKYRKNDFDF